MANDDPKPDVLSSLPRTRPQRRSAKRDPVKPASKPKAKPKARAAAAPRKIPPAGFAPPEEKVERPAPGAAEIVGTAIQAAGELAQIGLAIGGQALRSALGRGRE